MASTSPDHNNDALLHESLLPTDERILSASANVLRQLPTGSVMALYALSSSFTNRGECQPANWWLSLALVILLTVSCSFFSFTDSFVLEGKLYYGVATPGRLILLNLSKRRGETEHLSDLCSDELKKRRLRWDDCVRALFTTLVLLAFAFGDIGMQNCFFPQAGFDAKQLLKNMPLLVVVVSSFVLMMCPTRRKGITYFLTSGSCSNTVLSSSRVTTSFL